VELVCFTLRADHFGNNPHPAPAKSARPAAGLSEMILSLNVGMRPHA